VYLDEIVDHRVNGIHNFVILYADDTLLFSPSISDLQRMFTACETELALLDMTINVKNHVVYALDHDLKPAARISLQ
jgi:hypothetical protein